MGREVDELPVPSGCHALTVCPLLQFPFNLVWKLTPITSVISLLVLIISHQILSKKKLSFFSNQYTHKVLKIHVEMQKKIISYTTVLNLPVLLESH